MSPESFTFFYSLGTTMPDATTEYGAPPPAALFSLTDDLDFAEDDMTIVGDLLSFTVGSTTDPVVLFGFTSNNDPVLFDGAIPSYFVLSNNGSLTGNIGFTGSGTYTYCFAAGTMISTPDGVVAVEELKIGDPILTSEGKSIPMKWLGRQTLRKSFAGRKVQPVRLRAGSLQNGVPDADLIVTGDHALILDGMAINASALVNGDTIDWVPLTDLPDIVTYYHVETDNHEVILANGTPAETFVDVADRKNFDNYEEYLALYGVERIIPEMKVPRISSARLLPHDLKARLNMQDNFKKCS